MTVWDRISVAVTHRRSWIFALLIVVASGALMAIAGSNADADKPPTQLPPSAESAKAAEMVRSFPGGERIPAVLVVSRHDDSSLAAGDIAAAESARQRVLSTAGVTGPPLIVSPDGWAAVTPIPVAATSGSALNETIDALRRSATAGAPAGLAIELTGGPAFGADIGNAMSSASIVLLAVTASVVAVLLIVTYRSPILWLVPLAVIGLADGLSTAVGSAVSRLTGLTFDGATAGITSVLVFGAGTNYALLLISRYREGLTGADGPSRRLANGGQPRRARRRGQQRDRRAGVTDPCFRRRPGHPQPRCACRGRAGDRGAAGPPRNAAAARPVRRAAVLAIHSRSGPRCREPAVCGRGSPSG